MAWACWAMPRDRLVHAVPSAPALCVAAQSRWTAATPPLPPAPLLQAERQQVAAELEAVRGEVAQQKAELADFAGNDPDRYEALSEQRCWCFAVLWLLPTMGKAALLGWVPRWRGPACLDPVAPHSALSPLAVLAVVSTRRAMQRMRAGWLWTRPTAGWTTPMRCGWVRRVLGCWHLGVHLMVDWQAVGRLVVRARGCARAAQCLLVSCVCFGSSSGVQLANCMLWLLQDWMKKKFEGSGNDIDKLFFEVGG